MVFELQQAEAARHERTGELADGEGGRHRSEQLRGIVRRARACLLQTEHGRDHEGAADGSAATAMVAASEPQLGSTTPAAMSKWLAAQTRQAIGMPPSQTRRSRWWTARRRCRRRARRGRTSAGRPSPRAPARAGRWPAGCSRSRARRSRSRARAVRTRRAVAGREPRSSWLAVAGSRPTKTAHQDDGERAARPVPATAGRVGTPGCAAARQNSPGEARCRGRRRRRPCPRAPCDGPAPACWSAHALTATIAQALNTPAAKRRLIQAASPSRPAHGGGGARRCRQGLPASALRQGEAQSTGNEGAGQVAQRSCPPPATPRRSGRARRRAPSAAAAGWRRSGRCPSPPPRRSPRWRR